MTTPVQRLVHLVHILKAARDAMTANWKASEKERIRVESIIKKYIADAKAMFGEK